MAGSSNFLQHNPTAANQENDATYASDSTRTGGIGTDQIMPSEWMNKIWYQSSTFIAAFSQALANKGYNLSDSSLTLLEAVLANVLTNADLKANIVPVAYSSTPNFNAAISNGFQITLAGNVTGPTVTGAAPGQILTLIIVQGSASYTFAAPANWVGWQNINPLANSVSVVSGIVREDGKIQQYQQQVLTFTPVQQGGGIGQATNKVYLGWSGSRLKSTVDTTDLGNIVFDNQLTAAIAPVQSEANATQAQLTALAALFVGTLSQNGEAKIPCNGTTLHIKWGMIPSMGGGDSNLNTINFPTAFPTSCFVVLGSTYGNTDRITYIVSFNAVSFQINNNGSGVGATWIAIGF